MVNFMHTEVSATAHCSRSHLQLLVFGRAAKVTKSPSDELNVSRAS